MRFTSRKLSYSCDPTIRYLGCVSRIDVGKGWEYYLQAIAKAEQQMPTSYKYLYVGSGKDEAAFKEMIKTLGLEEKVIHFPLLPQSSLAYVYNAIEAFVFPIWAKNNCVIGYHKVNFIISPIFNKDSGRI